MWLIIIYFFTAQLVADQPQFRQVPIANDKIPQVVSPAGEFVPVKRSEWEKTVQKVTELSEKNLQNSLSLNMLEEIEWQAELKEGILVGELHCRARKSKDGPKFLTLDPWVFTSKDGYWREKKEPLRWGTDAKGKVQIELTNDDTFVLPVRLAGKENQGDWNFTWSCPQALSRSGPGNWRAKARLTSGFPRAIDRWRVITL